MIVPPEDFAPKAPSLKTFAEFAPGVRIIAVCTYKDMVIVATESSVFKIKEGRLEEIQFEVVE